MNEHKIELKEGLVMVKKHKMTRLEVDVAIDDASGDEDKRLLTGEVLAGRQELVGKTAIFGKYSLLNLTIRGIDYHFLSEEDIVGFCEYKE